MDDAWQLLAENSRFQLIARLAFAAAAYAGLPLAARLPRRQGRWSAQRSGCLLGERSVKMEHERIGVPANLAQRMGGPYGDFIARGGSAACSVTPRSALNPTEGAPEWQGSHRARAQVGRIRPRRPA